MSQDPLRTALLRAASDVLLAVGEVTPAAAPVAETVSDDRWSVVVTVTACRQTPHTPPDSQSVPGETAEAIRLVLRTAGAPLLLATVARKANRDLSSHFRKVAYRMHRAGELTRHPGNRYSLTAR